MNCGAMRELLSQGQPLTEPAQHHIAACAGCRALVQALNMPEREPSAQRIVRIQGLIIASLEPVQPLQSDRKLTSILLAMFCAFSLLAAIPVGYNGFHVLYGYQRFAYYGLILLCAMLLASTVVQEIIPGSKHKTNATVTILGATLTLALLISLLFNNFDLNRFVSLGIPCLRLGMLCAVLSAALFWFFLRKGFVASPFAAGAIVGCFAGLAGIAVLALHCPIENSAHILVWHFGPMMLAGIAGAVGADLWRSKPPKRDRA